MEHNKVIESKGACDVNYEIDPIKLKNFKSQFNCIIRAFKNSKNENIIDINNSKLISFFEKALFELRNIKEEPKKKKA